MVKGLGTVSYTHLDVYKRQELEASFPSSKEGVHTFTEKCPLFGTVFFTVDDRTKQIIRAQVKQVIYCNICFIVFSFQRM